jgi:hypothetical protein
MMAMGSFKKVVRTALAARGEHDQISAVWGSNPAARIVRPVPNAAIWIGNEWIGTPEHRKVRPTAKTPRGGAHFTGLADNDWREVPDCRVSQS